MTGPSFTTPFYLGDGIDNGVGAQQFSGASIANIETANGGPLTTGMHQIVFQCFFNGTEANDSYRANFDYNNTTNSWTASAATLDPVAGAPGRPTANAADAAASVSWTAPAHSGSSAITSYTLRVFSGGIQVGSDILTGTTATTRDVTSLTNGTAYTFKVAATNGSGTGDFSAASAPVTPSAATAPGAPAAPTATPGDSSAQVAWSGPADNGGAAITSYTLQVLSGGIQVGTDIVTGTTATTRQVTGLTNGTAYTLKVAATNSVGTGGFSPESAAVTPFAATAPSAPGAPSATRGNASVSLTWAAPASDGGSPITGYGVDVWENGTYIGFDPFGNVTTGVVTGLINGATYTFQVFAVNAVGDGGNSASSNAVVPATVPAAPGVPAVTAGQGAATVSWAAPANNGDAITHYVVQSFKYGVLEKTDGSAGTSITVGGLTNGASYTFAVSAVNGVGGGAFSSQSGAVVPRLATKLVVTSAPLTLTYGVAPRIVGKLTLANGTTAVAGQRVYLQVRKVGSTAYASVASAVSTSTGAVVFTAYKPAYAINAIRLTRATSGAYLGASSPAKGVKTARKVTTRWSATSIRLRATATLSGSVAPNSRGKVVYLQKKVGTRWVNVASRALSSTSTYAFAVKPTARGTYYYRVAIGASNGYVATVRSAPALRVV